jgi:uncharacterized membrane protein YcfT
VGGSRVVWVDAAKGMSILLVVLHHVVSYLQVRGWVPAPVAAGNEALASLRMPLFFLASGLFVAGPMAAPWRTLLHKRVVFFLYLYVLWTLIRFAFFSTLVPPGVDPFGAADPTALVWSLLLPGPSMWFLYALALFSVIGKLVRRFPVAPVLITTGILSALVGAGVLESGTRWDYMARFLFFFLLGWHARTLVERLARATTLLRVAGAAVVCLLGAGAAVVLDLRAVPGVAFALNCVAVTFGVLFSGWLTCFRVSRPLVTLGRQTLPVYLMHMLWLAVIVTGLRHLPLAGAPPATIAYVLPVALTVVVVGLSLLTHQILMKARATWLFALPSRLAHRPQPARRPAPVCAC